MPNAYQVALFKVLTVHMAMHTGQPNAFQVNDGHPQ